MTDVKLASEGQRNFICNLMKERAGATVELGEYADYAMIPNTDRPNMMIEPWAAQLTFEQAKETLRYLVALPEPERPEGRQITPNQKGKIWAILKTLGCNTYRAWLLKKDDPDIPNLRWDDTDTSVWDWISGLTLEEAVQTIEHLEEVQKIVGR